jgi:hypothetical protein
VSRIWIGRTKGGVNDGHFFDDEGGALICNECGHDRRDHFYPNTWPSICCADCQICQDDMTDARDEVRV